MTVRDAAVTNIGCTAVSGSSRVCGSPTSRGWSVTAGRRTELVAQLIPARRAG